MLPPALSCRGCCIAHDRENDWYLTGVAAGEGDVRLLEYLRQHHGDSVRVHIERGFFGPHFEYTGLPYEDETRPSPHGGHLGVAEWLRQHFRDLADWSRLPDDVKSILRLLGPSLQVLRLSGLSDGQIQDITDACPHLRVLAVETQGTLAAVQFPPQLQLLHPILNTTEQLDFASTRLGEQLKTLRLAIDLIPTTHGVEHFILPLLRAKPRLLGFEWTSHCEPPPDVSEVISRILAGIWVSLEKSHNDIAIERDAPPSATMIALLSVVDHYSRKSTSALGRIERDSIEMIGSFVGTTVKRQVVITV